MEQKTSGQPPKPVRDQSERRSISMYPTDWAVVDGISDRLGVNVSSALRMVIRTWDGLNGGSDGNGEKSE